MVTYDFKAKSVVDDATEDNEVTVVRQGNIATYTLPGETVPVNNHIAITQIAIDSNARSIQEGFTEERTVSVAGNTVDGVTTSVILYEKNALLDYVDCALISFNSTDFDNPLSDVTEVSLTEDLTSSSVLVKVDVVGENTEPVITITQQGGGTAAFSVSTEQEGRVAAPGSAAFYNLRPNTWRCFSWFR